MGGRIAADLPVRFRGRPEEIRQTSSLPGFGVADVNRIFVDPSHGGITNSQMDVYMLGIAFLYVRLVYDPVITSDGPVFCCREMLGISSIPFLWFPSPHSLRKCLCETENPPVSLKLTSRVDSLVFVLRRVLIGDGRRGVQVPRKHPTAAVRADLRGRGTSLPSLR